jgi:hypothetical protein
VGLFVQIESAKQFPIAAVLEKLRKERRKLLKVFVLRALC